MHFPFSNSHFLLSARGGESKSQMRNDEWKMVVVTAEPPCQEEYLVEQEGAP
jgi:hypothetical protein